MAPISYREPYCMDLNAAGSLAYGGLTGPAILDHKHVNIIMSREMVMTIKVTMGKEQQLRELVHIQVEVSRSLVRLLALRVSRALPPRTKAPKHMEQQDAPRKQTNKTTTNNR